ncbi:hypothetical protein NW754_009573 [Fusarium falciforme]|nr:hypothetical protein NW754_009573 [Fusarium falciforme]
MFPREKGDYQNQSWGGADLSVDELLAPYPDLNTDVRKNLELAMEIRPWRLWIHQPYPYTVKKKVALLGDVG